MKNKRSLHRRLLPCLLVFVASITTESGRAQLASFTRAYDEAAPVSLSASNNSNMLVTPYYGPLVSHIDLRGYLMASNVENSNGTLNVKLTAARSNGDQLWTKTYGDNNATTRCFAITRDARDNGYVLTGYRSNTLTGKRRDYLWLLKVNANGDPLKEYMFSADSIPCTVINGTSISLCHSFAHPSIYGMDILQVASDPDSLKNGDFVVVGFMSEDPAVENYTTLKRNFAWRFRVAVNSPVTDTFAAAEPLTRWLKVYHSWGNAGSDQQPTSEDFATEVQEVDGHGLMILGHVTGAPITPTPPSVVRRPYYAMINYDGGGSSISSSTVFQYADYTNTANIKNVRTVYGKDDAIYLLGYYYPTHSFTVTPVKTTAGAAGLTRIYYSPDATDVPAFSMFENNVNSNELVVMGYRLGFGDTLTSSARSNFMHPYTIKVTKNGIISSKFDLDSIKSVGYINYAPANPGGTDYFRTFEKSAFPLASIPQIGLVNSFLGKNDAVVAGALFGAFSGTLVNNYAATLSQFQQITQNAECHPYGLSAQRDSVRLAYGDVKFNINNVTLKPGRITTTVNVIGSDHKCIEVSAQRTTGINSLSEDDAIHIYPNPSSDIVNIQATIANSHSYKITTVTGMLVASGTFEQNIAVPVSNWANGIYLFQISEQDGLQHVYKFVKQ